MDSFYQTVFLNPLKQCVTKVSLLLPGFLTFLIILVSGILIALVIRYATKLLFRLIQFDKISYRTGLSSLLSKGNIKRTPSDLLSYLITWAVILVFLVLDLSVLEMVAIESLLAKAVGYFVNFTSAIIIFIAGYALAAFAGRTVLIAAVNANMTGAKWISETVHFFIIAISLALGLEQLGIAKGIVVATFSIIFGGIILALALAFGIGGKDIAREILKKRFNRKPEKNESPDEFSHL